MALEDLYFISICSLYLCGQNGVGLFNFKHVRNYVALHVALHVAHYALYMPAFLGGASYVTVHVAVYAVFAVSLITQA